ncbi:MAG: RNA methyltransferase [Ignisphaera sp.]|uniref:RNA-binding protein n=2 Tax=Ignisphaera aggregans TaxID=334771 RepID=A0A832ANZ7_9CREN
MKIDEVDVYRRYMRPLRTKPFISIAIPASVVSDAKTLREQTLKVGSIGRAAAIFRVENIFIYRDPDTDADHVKFIQSILNYMEVPPYMKKIVVPITQELRYVGLLPPLKTPHHVPPEIFDTQYREGIVISRSESKCLIELGLDKKGVMRGRCPSVNTRVTVEIVHEDGRYYYVEIVDRESLDIYWGYRVQSISSLKEMLDLVYKNGYLIIVASKKGKPLYYLENYIVDDFRNKHNVLVVFGGPYLDVDEIAINEGIDIDKYANYIVNFVPRQGVENIRTEEAIVATLSILNYIKEKYINK